MNAALESIYCSSIPDELQILEGGQTGQIGNAVAGNCIKLDSRLVTGNRLGVGRALKVGSK